LKFRATLPVRIIKHCYAFAAPPRFKQHSPSESPTQRGIDQARRLGSSGKRRSSRLFSRSLDRCAGCVVFYRSRCGQLFSGAPPDRYHHRRDHGLTAAAQRFALAIFAGVRARYFRGISVLPSAGFTRGFCCDCTFGEITVVGLTAAPLLLELPGRFLLAERALAERARGGLVH